MLVVRKSNADSVRINAVAGNVTVRWPDSAAARTHPEDAARPLSASREHNP